MKPPSRLAKMRVLRWSTLDERHGATESCRHVVSGAVQGPPAGLAICQSDDGAFFLFGCDEDWNVVTDTWHETLQGALDQAAFEYSGIGSTWNVV